MTSHRRVREKKILLNFYNLARLLSFARSRRTARNEICSREKDLATNIYMNVELNIFSVIIAYFIRHVVNTSYFRRCQAELIILETGSVSSCTQASTCGFGDSAEGRPRANQAKCWLTKVRLGHLACAFPDWPIVFFFFLLLSCPNRGESTTIVRFTVAKTIS